MEGAQGIEIQRQKDRRRGRSVGLGYEVSPRGGGLLRTPVSSWASYLLGNLIRSLILMPIGQLHN